MSVNLAQTTTIKIHKGLNGLLGLGEFMNKCLDNLFKLLQACSVFHFRFQEETQPVACIISAGYVVA